MNTTEIANKIERMATELAELKTALSEHEAASQPQDNARWKPKHGEIYYHPNTTLMTFQWVDKWRDSDFDNHRYAAGMVYRTAEEAAEAGKRMYYTEMYRSMGDVTPEMWEDSNVSKCYAYWEHCAKSIGFSSISGCQDANFFFTTEDKCHKAIDKLGEDIFIRYVLGVVR